MSLPEHPLAFFEELLQKGGLQSLQDDFKPSKEEMAYHDVWYDNDEMCRISSERDEVTGDPYTDKFYFKDHLAHILEKELFKARRIFIDKLDRVTNPLKGSILENFIFELEYFIGKASRASDSSLIAKLPIIRQYLTLPSGK